MHFFRSLYNGNLIQRGEYSISISDNGSFTKGFSINSKTPINSDSFIIKKDSLSGYLKNAGELSVTYKWMNTLINIKWDSVYFEKDGYYDPVGIEFSGDMSKQRIGDLLPFEYFIK
jgi:hypothetical protein